ncbi:MAG: DHA2 family efflux MFS transporter permease subunit [Candidatus Dormibacter sp.]|uniref:DHA2 family efflux MFS transporter permease subunit n=1 Tax=Candidatus Dormibacter sp. TaxID=2973982 RepID=UPI000DAF9EE9|nr:MAG: MFS transporter [Candidatus Dormibacteraeota bacterium]
MLTKDPRRWCALGALVLAVLAIGLDGTVLSVALPTLAAALRASESDLQWFSSGYLLVLAAAMLPAGLLGDRWGRKRVLLASLAMFGAGSVACAYAPSPAAFIAARAVLGLAGAGLVVMALSALTGLFSQEERPRAVGIWAAANFLALPLGPILGGWLLTHYWWGWVFLMNVPVAVIGLIAAFALMPESRAAERPSLDPVGILASSAGLVALTYGLIQGGRDGWAQAATILPIAGGVLLLVGFFLWENRLTNDPVGRPLIDVSLFRSASFTWGVVLNAIGALGLIGVLFTMPQYFQGVVGADAMGSGLRLLPLIGGMLIGAVPADRAARLVGAKVAVAIGFAVLAAGLLLGATTGLSSGTGFVGLWLALVGAGTGLALATAASGALSQLPQERSGVGSAVMQALQKTGGPFGSAVLGSVLSSAYRARVPAEGLPPAAAAAVRESVFGGIAVADRLGSGALLESVRSAFVAGMDAALLVAAAIAASGMALTLVFLPGQRASTASQAEAPAEEPLAAG